MLYTYKCGRFLKKNTTVLITHMYLGYDDIRYYFCYQSNNYKIRESKSKRDTLTAEPWFINTKLKQNSAPSTYNLKHLRMFIFPSRSGAEERILHINRFFNTNQ